MLGVKSACHTNSLKVGPPDTLRISIKIDDRNKQFCDP